MNIEERVALLKTIADATRLRILGLLAAGPHSGRELAEALQLAAPTISHHMGRLVEAGPTDELFAHPVQDYTRELIEAVPGAGIDLHGESA